MSKIAEENAAIEARNKKRKEADGRRRKKQAREQKAFPNAYGREPEGG